MRNLIFGVLVGVFATTAWQAVTLSQSPAPPNMAFDITKADVDTLLKNYLSVRPDPGRVLPGGYVNPLLLKNQPAVAK